MQLLTLTSGLAAALLTSTVSAKYNFNATGNASGRVKIINTCDYPVYLWSIFDEQGCGAKDAVTLKSGDFYWEAYRKDAQVKTARAVSIKLSKKDVCKPGDITQVEYRQDFYNPGFNFLFTDISFVDCEGEDCPGRDKYSWYVGTKAQKAQKATDPAWCIYNFDCHDKVTCGKNSYVKWNDDWATHSCDVDADQDFYICGYKDTNKPVPAPSSYKEEPKPVTTQAPSKTEEPKVKAAAITEAPSSAEPPKVKTIIEYVTAYVDGKKRHVHGHAHRHFRA
ncbi:hypothetical protein B0J11DRAFT_59236 [Dendryphion nanum]|uniref:Uncharacterized protein n=1 Tax=Dendryphion nanum TaxID=256645 RepID=A0A9P9DID0_9PLEO|nr:hypothetical protein B0J11DRAFT_59236 [Dendryphion nanum]